MDVMERSEPGDAQGAAGEGARRRRGTRGGRGRGGRATEGDAVRETARPGGVEDEAPRRPQVSVDADVPRIVARRPSRAAQTPADNAPADTSSAAPSSAGAEASAPAPRRRASSATAAIATGETTAAAPATTRSAAPSRTARGDGSGDVAALLEEVRVGLRLLQEQVERSARRDRLGVFVDVPNLLYGAERGERAPDMGRLLAFLGEGRELVRATAYAPVSDNPNEPVQQQRFVAPFVPYEYRIVTKSLKRFADGSIKGNFDVEMTVDMLTMADRLDVMAIVSGDSDFAGVVQAIQNKGVRVEVVAFAGSTSAEMRALADRYIEVGSISHLLR